MQSFVHLNTDTDKAKAAELSLSDMVLVGQETEEQIRAKAYNKRMQELEVRLLCPMPCANSAIRACPFLGMYMYMTKDTRCLSNGGTRR